VIVIDQASELHRPRWEEHPTWSDRRQLHLGFDGHGGRDVHLVLATEVAGDLFELMRAIIDHPT
jgi:hypothetical protein